MFYRPASSEGPYRYPAGVDCRAAPAFLERLFDGKLRGNKEAIIADDLVKLALAGGFPEAISRATERRQQDGTRSYLPLVLTRDLRDIADIEKLTELPKFVRLLADHSGQTVNYSQFGEKLVAAPLSCCRSGSVNA